MLDTCNHITQWPNENDWCLGSKTLVQLFYFLFDHKTFQNKSQKHMLLDFQLFIFLFICFPIVLSSNKFFSSWDKSSLSWLCRISKMSLILPLLNSFGKKSERSMSCNAKSSIIFEIVVLMSKQLALCNRYDIQNGLD